METQRSNDNLESVDITTASDYIITDEVISHLQTQLKAAYEDTRPKIEKSVRNDLKETYESFKLLNLRSLIINYYDVWWHLCMINHQQLLIILRMML